MLFETQNLVPKYDHKTRRNTETLGHELIVDFEIKLKIRVHSFKAHERSIRFFKAGFHFLENHFVTVQLKEAFNNSHSKLHFMITECSKKT